MIENKINCKKYVGQTLQDDIKKRWNKHKQVNKSFIGTCLYNAYKKYGIENFQFKIVCICFDEDTNKYEEEYIKKYNTLHPFGYNMINGGNNRKFTPILKNIISAKLSGINHPNYGKQLKEETKQKLSIALTGIKNPNFGKSFSDETKNKLREKALNRFCSDITANKISESLKKFYKYDSKKIKNNIFVQQYDFKNNLINTFYSLS